MRKNFFLLCLLGILLAAESGLPVNLLQNGGFDGGLSWRRIPRHWGNKSYNQRVIKNPFREEFGKGLKIARQDTGYSIGAQIIDIEPAQNSILVISGYWQGEKIKINRENWNGAKVQIVFYDSTEKEIGQPYDIAHSTEDFDWQMFIKNVIVPQNAAQAKVLLGLWDAAGEVFIDELQAHIVQPNPAAILQNGDFESWGNWEFLGEGQTAIEQPAYNKNGQALHIKNTRTDWTFSAQIVPVTAGRAYRLSGVARHNAIRAGQQIWQKGRVYAEYLNAQGQVLGEPAALQYFEGTSDWKRFSAQFTPPTDASFAKLYFGLQNCTGEIAFDNLDLN